MGFLKKGLGLLAEGEKQLGPDSLKVVLPTTSYEQSDTASQGLFIQLIR